MTPTDRAQTSTGTGDGNDGHLLVDDELGLGDALLQALQAFGEPPPPVAEPPRRPTPPPARPMHHPGPSIGAHGGVPAAIIAAVAPALAAPSAEQERELAVTRARLERANGHIEDLKKQADRHRDHTSRFGNEQLLKALLPSIDNLQRAIDAAGRGTGDHKALLDGVRIVHRQLVKDLQNFGLTSFDSIGERFDPNRHEAVQQVPSDRYDAGTVVAEFSRGYLLHDRLLRPARVAVCSGVARAATAEPAAAEPATPEPTTPAPAPSPAPARPAAPAAARLAELPNDELLFELD